MCLTTKEYQLQILRVALRGITEELIPLTCSIDITHKKLIQMKIKRDELQKSFREIDRKRFELEKED